MSQTAKPAAAGPQPDVSIVVPVYGGRDCLQPLLAAIAAVFAGQQRSHEVILVNDCSPDGAWRVIEELYRTNAHVLGVDLRRNYGQDNAILTGLRFARGRFVAIMDDDLQHDPRDLSALLARAEEGADVVYAAFRVLRQKRWKRLGSWFNGVVAQWLLGKPRDVYLSPYKVIRKEVADAIAAYQGPDPYVDALLWQTTSRIVQVDIEHHPRRAGASTYTFGKSVKVCSHLAFSGSDRIGSVAICLGLATTLLGVLLAAGIACHRLLSPAAGGDGMLALLAPLVLGGVQISLLGVLAEYLRRNQRTVSQRPQSVIRQVLSTGTRSGEQDARGAA